MTYEGECHGMEESAGAEVIELAVIVAQDALNSDPQTTYGHRQRN